MKHVIIGAGIAGITAAKTIKQIDNHADVVVIGEERYFPYNRYLLTEFLCGTIDENQLFYTSSEFFREAGIKFRKGESVKFIDPLNKAIKLHHNEVLSYDKLLIATGGCPTLGPVLLPFQQHIQRYYSLKDILLIKNQLDNIKNCIVFGEGLSALDLMCGFCNLGKKVTYIVKGSKADFPAVRTDVFGNLQNFLAGKGIDIIIEDRVISVEKKENRYSVRTLNQKELVADIVFAWDYYKPNIKLIEGTKIEKKLGILVNPQLQTTVPDIYAAGDCVEVYHPKVKDYWINFGWPNALEQGTIAGKNMTGQQIAYEVHETIVFNLMGKPLKARWWE